MATAPTTDAFLKQVHEAAELRSEWSNMLAHQLPQLPPLDALLDRLPELLLWIDRPVAPRAAALPAARMAVGEVVVAPAGVQFWGTPAALEVARFAGENRLLIEFLYHGKARVAEPYSLRRSSTGKLLLYAWERGEPNIKAFDTADMRTLRATRTPFTPRYRVEFTAAEPLTIRSSRQPTRPRRKPRH